MHIAETLNQLPSLLGGKRFSLQYLGDGDYFLAVSVNQNTEVRKSFNVNDNIYEILEGIGKSVRLVSMGLKPVFSASYVVSTVLPAAGVEDGDGVVLLGRGNNIAGIITGDNVLDPDSYKRLMHDIVLSGAAALVVYVHRDSTLPSPETIQLSGRLCKSLKAFGIMPLDVVVINREAGEYYSFYRELTEKIKSS